MFSRVLTSEAQYSTASIAERLSWASNRRTTRVEDEAYCFMGLFNIDIPTIFGEGRQAFQRDHEAVVRHQPLRLGPPSELRVELDTIDAERNVSMLLHAVFQEPCPPPRFVPQTLRQTGLSTSRALYPILQA